MFGRYVTGFTNARFEALAHAKKLTGESDLEVYDAHILRQLEKNRQTPTGSDGGARFGEHRDNHDNPGSVGRGKSTIRYSMSIILNSVRPSAVASSMQVLEPSGLSSVEYPRVAGGYTLFRSQALHKSTCGAPHQGTIMKLVFFFRKIATKVQESTLQLKPSDT